MNNKEQNRANAAFVENELRMLNTQDVVMDGEINHNISLRKSESAVLELCTSADEYHENALMLKKHATKISA